MTVHIAFYGKGGSGKSTLATNVAAALAESGRTVVLIGCDPKANSVALLHPPGGARPVLAALAAGETLNDVVGHGYSGIACIEVGNAMGSGFCVAHGIDRALGCLAQEGRVAALDPDFVLYDMPGETGCPGFHIPVLDTLIQRAYLVTSADLMSLYAANSQLEQLHSNPKLAGVQVGFIANGMTDSFEETLVVDFAAQLRVPVTGRVPRSLVVRQCELYGKTVLEAAPLSNHAYAYRKIARQINDGVDLAQVAAACPKGSGELQYWACSWGDRIAALEHGLLEWGAGI